MRTTYPDEATFFAEDERRRRSPQVDYGIGWRTRMGVCWRASWLAATGEFYVIRLGRPNGPLSVLGVEPSRQALDRRLANWADAYFAPGSLDWLYGRFFAE